MSQLNRQEQIALIRDQVRTTVDPMLIRLRQELFGSTFNGSIRESLIPRKVINDAVEQGIEEGSSGLGLVPTYTVYTAGGAGVQLGKVVYFDGSAVHHASANDIGHTGKVVGVAVEAGGPGSPVKIQTYGSFNFTGFVTFSAAPATMLVGNTGNIVATPAAGSVFIQTIGISLTSVKLFIVVTPDIYLV